MPLEPFLSNASTHLPVQDVAEVHFLGLNGRSAAPFYPAWSRDKVSRVASFAASGMRDVRPAVSPFDPAEAGWGIVVPKGHGEAILRALEPLLRRRREQAGRLFRQFEFVPGESAAGFRRRHQAGIGPVDPERLPYYLLLAGGPELISWDVQFDLDVQHAVGRLAFAEVESYAAYAAGIVSHEERPARHRAGLDLFSFDHENDAPTRQGREELIRPLAQRFTSDDAFEVRTLEAHDATRDQLAQSLADGPSVVFTMGHSILYDADDADLQRLQGSLLTGEWRRGEEVQPHHVFWPDDVSRDADLRGRVIYLYGCHTAGTPQKDGFDPEPVQRQVLAQRPFVAPLAQRLLGHPGGAALAVIGQVDRALPCTSLGWDGVHQIDTFVDTLQEIFRGRPVGRALESFGQRYADVAVRMVEGRFRGGEPAPDPVALWSAYQDARSVCLLGDPLTSVAANGGNT